MGFIQGVQSSEKYGSQVSVVPGLLVSHEYDDYISFFHWEHLNKKHGRRKAFR
jgi:hypothetical protein